jgi:hypothetical protein
MSQHDAFEHCPVAAQHTLQLPPPIGRLLCVAAGLSEWSLEEKAWLEQHPKYFLRELEMRLALQQLASKEEHDLNLLATNCGNATLRRRSK